MTMSMRKIGKPCIRTEVSQEPVQEDGIVRRVSWDDGIVHTKFDAGVMAVYMLKALMI